MSVVTYTEIERKFFDVYEGDKDVFFAKEHGLFLSLSNNNIYCFKVRNEGENHNNLYVHNAKYPTCVLESCVSIDDIKEHYHKKYLNRYCISLFSTISHFYYSNNNLFLSTDDNNIHHYVLVLNDQTKIEPVDEKKEEINDEDIKDKIYLYDHEEDKEKSIYSYNYNWVHLEKIYIWKTDNIVITCFYFNNIGGRKLVVGYINGLINVFDINTYRLLLSYKIHNSRITNLKMYKNFIISSDITKNIFIYDVGQNKKIMSCQDHMSGIMDFLFLAVQDDRVKKGEDVRGKVNGGGKSKVEKSDSLDEEECDKRGEEESDEYEEEEEEDKLIGFISIGNDKIMNIWNLSMLNSRDEGEYRKLREQKNSEKKKEKKKKENSAIVTCSPIKQIYLGNDINSALIISSSVFTKNKKSKLIIKDENIKWLILTHDSKGNLLFYNPLKGDIIFKFKENKLLINESNIKKFFLLKYKLYIFREDSSLLIYDIRNFKLIKNYLCKIEGIFEMLLFNPNSSDITDEQNKRIEEEKLILDVKCDYNDKEDIKCIILMGDSIIRILSFEDNVIIQTLLIRHEDVVSCIKLNETNNLLFSGSNDKNIFVWSLKSNTCLYILKDNLYSINAIDVNLRKFPSVILVSVCEDCSLKLWNFIVEVDNMEKEKKKKKRKLDEIFTDLEIVKSNFTIYPHKILINDVAISPKGKMVATCSKDKTIKLFETRSLKLIKILEGHKKSVQNVLFSKTNQLLYSNSYDSVRIWNIKTFECLKSIQSLDFNITKMLILNDICMINAYSNGNISIINIKNCEKISNINYHNDKIFCLQNCNNHNLLLSASVNGELMFLKNISEKIVTENMFEKRKHIFYENCLENLLKEKRINESLLICLKLGKKYKFKSIIENYLNFYTFSILNILKKFEHEYGLRKIVQRGDDTNGDDTNGDVTNSGATHLGIKKEFDFKKERSHNESYNKEGNINRREQSDDVHVFNVVEGKKDKSNEVKSLNVYSDDTVISNIQNYLENADILENYIYIQLSKMLSNESDNSMKVEKGVDQRRVENMIVKNENNLGEKSQSALRETEQRGSDLHNDDDNFVLFLRKMKKKSEHSYFLYLNRLMEFITFFIINHRFAYISNFLLNSVIKYIDYADICKINNYQHFFEIYNSYIPRHKNRYLKSLQKSKCFELININYYKGDIKMMN
ncbi:U3 small nucleolar RNA-associated protein 13 [Plasmodium brasilianum]|uniref:U3 small nucleolar RNA-associated protein 13 n=2 Tax=Plasmodium (Plasmodium) TaxID=418103 RepID=A0ACB9YB42_PLABR|nr:U3 small nucleolar RNA-associated protein 13 [Plasmodium brasilianum]SBS84446.1 U3 small nucleolar RNA-associated protein 13, putative (UTP13) [Plasmodium malariae]